jgi:hypothetical protein
MSDREYTRLTRLRRRGGKFFEGFSSYGSLWLGRDHLLSINSTLFSEDYKRFYFPDIQALTIVETRRRRTWNFVLGIMLVLLIAVALSNFNGITSLTPSLMIGVTLLLNNALGPTCTVYIRTAVQVEELYSLKRVRRAQKVFARIRPLIQAAQAELGPEDLSARLQELSPRTTIVTGPLGLSG